MYLQTVRYECKGVLMGLDVIEFMMAVEDAFQFRFSDEECVDLTTPRRLIDFLTANLPTAAQYVCPSQRIFYRLRTSLTKRLGCSRSTFHPNTSLLCLIPSAMKKTVWQEVRQDLGPTGMPHWPRLDSPGWFDWFRTARIDTLREATVWLAAHTPGAWKIVQGHEAGWTRDQVAEAVHRLIEENFGIQRPHYTEDSRWTEDMGYD
jgi:hypothetical protein